MAKFLPSDANTGDGTSADPLPSSSQWEVRGLSLADFPPRLYPRKFRRPDDQVGSCLVVVPEGTAKHCHNSKMHNHFSRNGSLLCFRPTHLVGARRPRTVGHSYNAQLVREWMAICQSGHSLRCNLGVKITGFRLIDCKTCTVVAGDDSKKWLALSYVWSIASPPDSSQIDRATGKLPQNLPLVIKDAITVTQELGFRYLWVDRYCIDQTDRTHIQEQIDKMELIFRGAELTLVHATERNGLPGVGSLQRVHRKTVKLDGDISLVMTGPDARASINDAPWSFRGWTFQEGLLSRRLLYFTDHELVFQCKWKMSCYESWTEDEDYPEDRELETEAALNGTSVESSLKWIQSSLVQFLRTAESYTTRELTFGKDSLNAFRGIMKTFEGGASYSWHWGVSKSAIYNFHGLPTLTNRRRDFSDLERQVLTLSLSWRHGRPQSSNRRVEFPSWSWAGWHGLVLWGIKSASPISDFQVYSTILELVDPTEVTDVSKSGSSQSRIDCPTIRLSGCILPRELFIDQSSSDGWTRVEFAGFKLGRTDLWDTATTQGEVLGLENMMPIQLFEQIKSETLRCILLGGWAGTEGTSEATKSHIFELRILVVRPLLEAMEFGRESQRVERAGFFTCHHHWGGEREAFDISSMLDVSSFLREEVLLQ
jgi:hypothetical protein